MIDTLVADCDPDNEVFTKLKLLQQNSSSIDLSRMHHSVVNGTHFFQILIHIEQKYCSVSWKLDPKSSKFVTTQIYHLPVNTDRWLKICKGRTVLLQGKDIDHFKRT